MSSSARIAEDIGWDDGLEIPVANAENKKVWIDSVDDCWYWNFSSPPNSKSFAAITTKKAERVRISRWKSRTWNLTSRRFARSCRTRFKCEIRAKKSSTLRSTSLSSASTRTRAFRNSSDRLKSNSSRFGSSETSLRTRSTRRTARSSSSRIRCSGTSTLSRLGWKSRLGGMKMRCSFRSIESRMIRK